MNIIFTTCQSFPNLSASDAKLARALEVRGHYVYPTIWNSKSSLFEKANFIVLRAHWDYHEQPKIFNNWLSYLETLTIPVQNSPQIVRWNSSKRYLLELAKKGIFTPKSVILEPEDNLAECFEREAFSEAIVKPLYGASGYLVERVTRKAIDEWESKTRVKRPNQGWLVQAFLSEILVGELSLIFIAGHYSHTILKRPKKGEFRVNSQYQGISEVAYVPENIIKQAKSILNMLDGTPLYARVDGIIQNRQFCLIELELNEPELFFHLVPEQTNMFANAIETLFN